MKVLSILTRKLERVSLTWIWVHSIACYLRNEKEIRNFFFETGLKKIRLERPERGLPHRNKPFSIEQIGRSF